MHYYTKWLIHEVKSNLTTAICMPNERNDDQNTDAVHTPIHRETEKNCPN